MRQCVTFFFLRLMGSRSRAFRQEQANTSKSLIGIDFTENVLKIVFFWMSHWTLGGGPSWFGWMTIDFRQRLMIQSLVHFPVLISQGPNFSQGHVQPSKNWVMHCGPLHLKGCYVPYSLSHMSCKQTHLCTNYWLLYTMPTIHNTISSDKTFKPSLYPHITDMTSFTSSCTM